MNLPNKITTLRIILIPFIIFFYLSTSFIACGKLIAAAVFAVACLTDFLDGYIARKYNLVTNLGKFLDSIADKMLVLGAMVLVVADQTIMAPWGVISFAIIIFRELMVSALRQLAATKNVVIAADMWGKVKANFQFFAVLLFMVFAYFVDHYTLLSTTVYNIFEIVCYVLLFLTVFSTIISGVHYIVANKKVFADEKAQKEKIEEAQEKEQNKKEDKKANK